MGRLKTDAELTKHAEKYNRDNPWNIELFNRFLNLLDKRDITRMHNSTTNGCYENEECRLPKINILV